MTNRKIRFNFVDLLILAVIALAAVLLLYVFVWSGRTPETAQTQYTDIEYVVEIQRIDEAFVSQVRVGQAAEDLVERKQIGTIRWVETTPAQDINFNFTTGQEEYSEVEGKVNLYLTISAQAIETESSYTVDSYEIRVGRLVSLLLPNFQCNGYCIELTKLS